MITRKYTRRVIVGGVTIGGGAPIAVQSMTNTSTREAEATLAQVAALHEAGCALVRVTVDTPEALASLPEIISGSPIPIVADVHFSARLAIGAVEAGVAKLRINPGNLPGGEVARVAHACRAHGVPIRVGVNGGSLPADIVKRLGATPEAMLEAARMHIALLEAEGFDDIIVSLKASDAARTLAAVRAFAQVFHYPQHLGVTEAGLPEEGAVRSAVGLGAMLLDGLGDTLRVSLTGDPIPEVAAAYEILAAAGLGPPRVELVSCPTCGRCAWQLEPVARQVRQAIRTLRPSRTVIVAVMGCVVNGPGEAKEADIGVAGGAEGAALFQKGMAPRKVPYEGLAERLIDEVTRICAQS